MVFLIIPIPSQTHVHLGNQHELFAGDGVFQLQTSGAEHLAFQTPAAFFGAVLGITQNGESHVGTMDPELVGTASDGP